MEPTRARGIVTRCATWDIPCFELSGRASELEHLTGHFNVTRFASAWFRQQRKGRLIFFSSGAMFGSAGQPNYAAAKGGIYAFARSCANALQKYGVTVNVILPSASTRLMDRTLNAQQQTAELDFLPSERNRGTRRDPTNVAPWLVFLASDAGQEFNGQAFGVRGHEVGDLHPSRGEVRPRERR